MVQTVVKEQYNSETLTFRNELFETEYTYEINGQTVDRSYEDRDVYFNGVWLRGEDAIELGQALIKHGTRALKANMINHQLIHESNRLKKWLNDGIVEKVVMTMVDEKPANHGAGFHTFSIQPVFKQSMTPEYYEDFRFEHVIYWSPFEAEFNKQIKAFGGNVEFIGYDHDEAVAKFNEWCKQMSDERSAAGDCEEMANIPSDSTESPSER